MEAAFGRVVLDLENISPHGSKDGPQIPTSVTPPDVPQGPGAARPRDASDRTRVSRPLGLVSGEEAAGLLLVSAPDPGLIGSYFPLVPGEVLIGRAAGAAVRVEDPGISRAHVKIVRGAAGEVIAQDLGSTNGTFLNGVVISSATLVEGDRLQIGTSTEFLFGVRREGARAEILLRQAISTAGAGTWEWVPATGILGIYGGITRALGTQLEATEPRLENSWARVHPGDWEALRSRLASALESGSSLECEVRLLCPGGGFLWAAMSGEPFTDRDGRTVRLAGALLDVTERRRAEVELRRQSLLFDSLADAVVVVGSEGAILDWSGSAAKLLGWSKAEALGRRPGALLVTEGSDALDEDLAACARGGVKRSLELVLRAKSGADIPVEMTAVPLVSGEENLVACVAVFRDLRERKRLEARLQVAERLASLGTLAAGVAHEINNPLSFVISNLEYIGNQLAELAPSLGQKYGDLAAALADGRRGGERIATIVRDLQAFCGRERKAVAGSVDPNLPLEFALRMVESRIRRRARLVKDLAPVPAVQGGESRLGQVFLNLLMNAYQAIPAGRASESLIRVSSRLDAASGRVVIEVADDGVGIPPDVLPRVFEPFYTTKEIGEGTGLGLFVCQGIVDEVGGAIAVESRVGEGTTFRVYLPIAGFVQGRERPRILVVDDEPLVVAGLQRLLSSRYDVVTATDPREALARVRSGERFAFVLVDLQMPEMSGVEFMVALRESAPELARHAAVVTGESPHEVSVRYPELPPVLAKPIDMAKLVSLIQEVAGKC